MNEPIILLPGLVSDDRLFCQQRSAIPSVVAPAWIPPEPNEKLPAYARRLARQLDPGRPCYVGGVSFGGMVALEMAAALHAKGCFLIGSVRSRRQLPFLWRFCQLALAVEPEEIGDTVGLTVRRWLLSALGAIPWRRRRQATKAESLFLRWAPWAAVCWQPSPETRRVPVHQIHGDRDRVVPVRLTHADVVVPGGGHLLTLTHPEAVTEFLLSRIALASEHQGSMRPDTR